VSQGLDTDASNPTSRLLLHILAAVAEFERELIKERVSARPKHAKGKRTRIGRPRRVFRRDQAAELRAKGMSWRKIAAELGVPVTTI
jgi:putative DNA-invertase from lambdoid prophage Rac